MPGLRNKGERGSAEDHGKDGGYGRTEDQTRQKIGEVEREGVVSMLCGLLSLLFIWDGAALVLLILAFIFGFESNSKAKKEKLPKSSYAEFGILLAVVTVIIAAILILSTVHIASEQGATINWFSCRAFTGMN